ncbi:hypothetical protein ACLM5J_13560 [Nocardioides sp. Bht2]|uniref:hypothetical protein n=1 Tax=Nocardioides sp. Bht2 TaxID=3392297 RepID=UPI0039B44AD1
MAAVAAGALIVVGFGTTGAVADRLIGSSQIKKNAVTSKHIANGTISSSDLSSSVRKQLAKTGKTGPAGARGPAGPAGSISFEHAVMAGTPVVDNIGGSIKERYTDLDTSITLQPGTYQISVDGSFINGTALDADAKVYPQLSVWIDKNKDGKFDWNADASLNEGSISPNALIPTVIGRHIQVSGSTVLTVSAPTTVQLVAFGYDAAEQSTGAGTIKVNAAEISALKVG